MPEAGPRFCPISGASSKAWSRSTRARSGLPRHPPRMGRTLSPPSTRRAAFRSPRTSLRPPPGPCARRRTTSWPPPPSVPSKARPMTVRSAGSRRQAEGVSAMRTVLGASACCDFRPPAAIHSAIFAPPSPPSGAVPTRAMTGRVHRDSPCASSPQPKARMAGADRRRSHRSSRAAKPIWKCCRGRTALLSPFTKWPRARPRCCRSSASPSPRSAFAPAASTLRSGSRPISRSPI